MGDDEIQGAALEAIKTTAQKLIPGERLDFAGCGERYVLLRTLQRLHPDRQWGPQPLTYLRSFFLNTVNGSDNPEPRADSEMTTETRFDAGDATRAELADRIRADQQRKRLEALEAREDDFDPGVSLTERWRSPVESRASEQERVDADAPDDFDPGIDVTERWREAGR